MIDDVVYYSSLLLSISLAGHYKSINEPDMKRNYGAGLGILTACLICGHTVIHAIIMVWGTVVIIKCCEKRYVHQLSMAYVWTYLLYLHYTIASYQYVIWLHQIIALRLVGLAFEVNNADKVKPGVKNIPVKTAPKDNVGDIAELSQLPSAPDIIAYSFYFIGLHKGPYYRWKVYNDHLSAPVTVGVYRVITMWKLKKTIVCALTYLLVRLQYSPEIYQERSFYVCFGTDYRFLHNIPQLFMYLLKSQIVLLLCTAVCTEAGFGVYPAKFLSTPGYGPLEQTVTGRSVAGIQGKDSTEYNFSMLKCFENEKVLLGPKMKDTMRGWDMATGYWFWAYVYKNFEKKNKEIRTASSFLAWTVWCGLSLQQIILSSTLWVYINLEDEYSDLFKPIGSMKLPWDIGFSIMRLFCLLYLTPCLVISDVSIFLKYYNSIYWIYHFVMLTFIVVAIILAKTNMFGFLVQN